MSKKAYSDQEREQIRRDLLSVGLEMLSQRGLKNTRLQDILQTVGISKPFFYNYYYDSLAELVVHIIDYEIALILDAASNDRTRKDLSLEAKINRLIKMAVHSREHHLFVMTQEEEMWVHKHLSPEGFDSYQQGQIRFYEQLLSLWHIPLEICTPKELGNLLMSVVLIYNSAARSLPFFFVDELEQTAHSQACALSRYLASLVDD